MKKNYSFLWLFHSFLFLVLFSTMVYGQSAEDNPGSGTTYSISNIEEATNGECNGSIAVEITPYEPPYEFVWSNGVSTDIGFMDGLCPGAYSVIAYQKELNAGTYDCNFELLATVGGSGGCYIQYETWQVEQITVQQCSEQGQDAILLQGLDGNGYGTDYWYLGTLNISSASGVNYSYEWNSNSNLDSETEITTPGNYRVKIWDSNYEGCNIQLNITVVDQCDTSSIENIQLVNKSISPPVIINEFSNGSDGFDEYVELLVLGDYPNCEPVDLRNFIIDDNNGDFSPASETGASGRGVSPGHLRFPNTEKWSSIPIGALIVIYNEKSKNESIGLDDLYDQNEDGVYILPASEMEGDEYIPTLYDKRYSIKAEYDQGYWSNISMFDHKDAIQVRYPDGTYCHGISYGSGSKVNGGPEDMKIDYQNGKGKVYLFEGISPFEPKNYTVKEAARDNETPGASNNEANAYFIETLCMSNEYKWQVGQSKYLQAQVHPNPFENYLQLSINSEKDYIAEISLVDFMGNVVLVQKAEIIKGINRYQLNLRDNQVINGLYNLKIIADKEVLFSQKVVCVK